MPATTGTARPRKRNRYRIAVLGLLGVGALAYYSLNDKSPSVSSAYSKSFAELSDLITKRVDDIYKKPGCDPATGAPCGAVPEVKVEKADVGGIPNLAVTYRWGDDPKSAISISMTPAQIDKQGVVQSSDKPEVKLAVALSTSPEIAGRDGRVKEVLALFGFPAEMADNCQQAFQEYSTPSTKLACGYDKLGRKYTSDSTVRFAGFDQGKLLVPDDAGYAAKMEAHDKYLEFQKDAFVKMGTAADEIIKADPECSDVLAGRITNCKLDVKIEPPTNPYGIEGYDKQGYSIVIDFSNRRSEATRFTAQFSGTALGSKDSMLEAELDISQPVSVRQSINPTVNDLFKAVSKQLVFPKWRAENPCGSLADYLIEKRKESRVPYSCGEGTELNNMYAGRKLLGYRLKPFNGFPPSPI